MRQSRCAPPSSFPRLTCTSVLLTVGWRLEKGGGGSVGNNLQMKYNPFRSNAISGRADGQTAPAPKTHTHTHTFTAPTKARDSIGVRRRWFQREGRRRMGNKPRYKNDRGQVGEGGCCVFCSDIAAPTPSELDIKSPCQALPTLKDT